MSRREAAQPRHPISVVAERTGLSVDVLRMWERRYGVVEPARDEGGRRLYSDADIERLRLLVQATGAGRSVGQVVGLSLRELQALVREDAEARWSVGRPRELAAGGEKEYVERALARARELDAGGLERELRRGAALLGLMSFLEGVVAPLFRALGDAWHAGELGIAHEHLASAVARPLLAELRASLPAAADAPVLVVGTPAGEPHEFGALLVAGVAAGEGWRVVYLGADVPAAELARAARDTGARAVALSSVYAVDSVELGRELRSVRSALPAGVVLLVGGAAAARLESRPSQPGLHVLSGLPELRDHLRK